MKKATPAFGGGFALERLAPFVEANPENLKFARINPEKP